MHPAQRVTADVELAGVIADDDRIGQQPMVRHAAPQRPLGGDPDRVGMHLESRDPDALQMGRPRRPIRLLSCSASRAITGPER